MLVSPGRALWLSARWQAFAKEHHIVIYNLTLNGWIRPFCFVVRMLICFCCPILSYLGTFSIFANLYIVGIFPLDSFQPLHTQIQKLHTLVTYTFRTYSAS